ncbi:MAG: tetratricopeptide repeat protein [Polyangiaceae bacterium]|nr:tetratricopeptide repeat protein [Polyangiaceae bacterium]
MGFSVARLTLHALLSAVEEDLRETVDVHLGQQLAPEVILGKPTFEKACSRLDSDSSLGAVPPSLQQILAYVDFGDLHQTLNTHSAYLPQPLTSYLHSATVHFETLIPIRNRVAHSRPLHLDDLATVLDTTQQLTQSHDVSWTSLKETLHRLRTEPSFVLGLHVRSYESYDKKNHNLPIPDFDETGFLGRKQQVTSLLKLCKGPYPVITILADGGMGKTALALKVAYDLLDSDDNPFDAIVWTSSKTMQLTSHEIVRIQGAICDSLGMLQHVASHLGGTSAKEPVQEVLAYLEQFKILLILDNLETVLDERIRGFLAELPMGSKVLITSRIGLGAFEYPFRLTPFADGEAVQFVRALARSRHVETLTRIANPQLSVYCSRLHNNPGFIKWFVSVVQAGRRPEEALQNPDTFLEFCMSNVYHYLSPESRHVLRSMQSVPGRHSQAELGFLSEMDVLELQRALQQLVTTNMVSMSSMPRGSSFESQYDISDLARAYLSKHHPVEISESTRIVGRRNQLLRAGESLREDQISNPYSAFSISMRSDSDIIVAKYLRDALDRAHRNDYASADSILAKAHGLAPEYFEVFRVEAWIRAKQGNAPAARSAYESAVELEPKSAPLLYFFGGFLMRNGDMTEAMGHLAEATRIDPNEPAIHLEAARANLYALKFTEARSAIDRLISRSDLSEWVGRKAYDLHLQYFMRLADHDNDRHAYSAALSELEKLRDAYENCPNQLRDSRMREGLKRALNVAKTCARNVAGDDARTRANTLTDWIAEEAFAEESGIAYAESRERLSGTVYRLHKQKATGAILTTDGQEFRFERSLMLEPAFWAQVRAGSQVDFRKGRDARGPCALDVVLRDTPRGTSGAE